MTEAEWLTATDPAALLRCAQMFDNDPRSRKFRYFALNCCRLVFPLVVLDSLRLSVEIAELQLVGLETEARLEESLSDVGGSGTRLIAYGLICRDDPLVQPDPVKRLQCRAEGLATKVTLDAVCHGYHEWMLVHTRDALAFSGTIDNPNLLKAFTDDVCLNIRDIFGNPFRPMTFSHAWRTDTAVSLARGMYKKRDFSAMPILADALQDAGCDSDDILSHCRDATQVHVRGCWVVDLLLGKE